MTVEAGAETQSERSVVVYNYVTLIFHIVIKISINSNSYIYCNNKNNGEG